MALLAATLLFMFASPIHANPGGFPPGAKSAVATSSVNFLTPGTGTTTTTYDSYNINGTNQPTTGLTSDTDSATLLVQFVGSSTSAVLGISYEYSQDGVDWYKDSTTLSTTTVAANITTPNSLSWTYAGLTLGGAGGTSATTTRILSVGTPTRYVRAVFTMTGANGAIWDQFVPKKQTN